MKFFFFLSIYQTNKKKETCKQKVFNSYVYMCHKYEKGKYICLEYIQEGYILRTNAFVRDPQKKKHTQKIEF